MFLVLCILFCGWTSFASAHTIYMKDGSVIRADTVWEETLGYFLDEVSLYAYKKSGMPEHLVKRLAPLENQLLRSKNRLFQLIRQEVGDDTLKRYQSVIERYLVARKVVSYDKYGDTIHLERSKVKRVEYSSPPPSLAAGFIDPEDTEAKRAIDAEKAMLYERLREIRDKKSAYVPKDDSGLPRSGPVDYKKEMRKTQQQIKELEHNPLGYFLRYYPELVNFRGKPSSSDCYKLCGGASSSVAPPGDEQEEPVISATSDEKLQGYKRCMASCLGDEKEPEEVPKE